MFNSEDRRGGSGSASPVSSEDSSPVSSDEEDACSCSVEDDEDDEDAEGEDEDEDIEPQQPVDSSFHSVAAEDRPSNESSREEAALRSLFDARLFFRTQLPISDKADSALAAPGVKAAQPGTPASQGLSPEEWAHALGSLELLQGARLNTHGDLERLPPSLRENASEKALASWQARSSVNGGTVLDGLVEQRKQLMQIAQLASATRRKAVSTRAASFLAEATEAYRSASEHVEAYKPPRRADMVACDVLPLTSGPGVTVASSALEFGLGLLRTVCDTVTASPAELGPALHSLVWKAAASLESSVPFDLCYVVGDQPIPDVEIRAAEEGAVRARLQLGAFSAPLSALDQALLTALCAVEQTAVTPPREAIRGAAAESLLWIALRTGSVAALLHAALATKAISAAPTTPLKPACARVIACLRDATPTRLSQTLPPLRAFSTGAMVGVSHVRMRTTAASEGGQAACSTTATAEGGPAMVATRLVHHGDDASGSRIVVFADGITGSTAYFEASACTSSEAFTLGVVDTFGAQHLLKAMREGGGAAKVTDDLQKELKRALGVSMKHGGVTSPADAKTMKSGAAAKETIGLFIDLDAHFVERYVDGKPNGPRVPCFLPAPLFLFAALGGPGEAMTVARRPLPTPTAGLEAVDPADEIPRAFVVCAEPTSFEAQAATVELAPSGPDSYRVDAAGGTRTQLMRTQLQSRPIRFRGREPISPSAPFLEVELPGGTSKSELRIGVTPTTDDLAIGTAASDDGFIFSFDIGYLEMQGHLGLLLNERSLHLFNRESSSAAWNQVAQRDAYDSIVAFDALSELHWLLEFYGGYPRQVWMWAAK